MARFFGFDLGDGESAVCFLASNANANVSPQSVQVFGEDCFISTYGRSDSNEVLLGNEAINDAIPTSLHARFKRNYLNDPRNTAVDIRTFACAVHDDLEATGQDIDADDVTFAVGCPSSWNETARNAYKSIFEAAGFRNVQVISESRAAFIFAKQAGLCSYDDLKKLVLIIDAGSSTMDMTIVDSFVPNDFGDPKLGAGLIDQELLRLNEKREEALHDILTEYPAWRVRYELDARKLKEDYFIKENKALKANTAPRTARKTIITEEGNISISCSQEDMKQILATQLDELKGNSFIETYKRCLEDVKRRVEKLDLIILTGGASRMSFIRAMAANVFPDARIVQGNSPELSIAQGLAYTLSIDCRVKDFREEIEELTKPGGQIESLIKERLNVLFADVVEPAVKEMIKNVIMPEFRRWKGHEIKSLNDMEDSIKANAKVHFDGAGKQVVVSIVGEWLTSLGNDIERLTDPICLKYNIQPGGLKLNIRPIGIPGTSGGPTVNPTDFLLVQIVQHVVNAIIAILITTVVVALGATGPIGITIGIIAFLVAMVCADDAINSFMQTADIPSAVRYLISENRVENKLNENLTKMKDGALTQMKDDLAQPTEDMTNLYTGILGDLKAMLREKVEKIAILLR